MGISKKAWLGILGLMLCFGCGEFKTWDSIRKNIEPTSPNDRVTILMRDIEERETLVEFKQRVHKHCEWMAAHGRVVIRIKYAMIDKLAKRSYIGRANIYWRKDDS